MLSLKRNCTANSPGAVLDETEWLINLLISFFVLNRCCQAPVTPISGKAREGSPEKQEAVRAVQPRVPCVNVSLAICQSQYEPEYS